MATLASQLAMLLPQDQREQYQKCARKRAYASLGLASGVAMRRQEATGQEFYCYPCPYDPQHWHLSHVPPTPAQVAKLEAYATQRQSTTDRELRQLKRAVDQARTQIIALKLRFQRLETIGVEGVPFPSRIRAHYAALRRLLAERRARIKEYLWAAYDHDVRIIAMTTCAEFNGPGTAWRAAVEAKLCELAEEVAAIGQAAEEAYARDLTALADDEAKNLQECQALLNQRYLSTC